MTAADKPGIQPEALRLAAWHEHLAKTCNEGERAMHIASAAELRRLHAAVHALSQINMAQREMLDALDAKKGGA